MNKLTAFFVGGVAGMVTAAGLLGAMWLAWCWILGVDWWPALVASIIVSGAFQQLPAKPNPTNPTDKQVAEIGALRVVALLVAGCRVILAVAALDVMGAW